MKRIWNTVGRELARIGERWMLRKRERDKAERRRRRIIEWEAFSARGGRARDRRRRQIDVGRAGCGFCTAARGWLLTQWRRLVSTLAASSARAAELMGRVRRLFVGEAPGRETRVTKRIFRRRAYAGSRSRRFELHVPQGYRSDTPVPLVMVLHGCRQNSSDIRKISNFDALADREGFIVVYPYVTSYGGMRIRNCWGWWLENEIRPGAGEVEDLWQIVEQIRGDFNVDDRRIHIAGLSSGGGMAVAAMVAHHDKFASGAAVAGVPYSETPKAVAYGAPSAVAFKPIETVVAAMRSVLGPDARPSPVFIVHSSDDPVVGIQAARNLRDSWAACYGIDPTRPGSKRSGIAGGVSWVHARYRERRRRSAIETMFIDGPGHGWYGGRPGRFSYPDAPDISALMWRFFKRHPIHFGVLREGGRAQLRAAV